MSIIEISNLYPEIQLLRPACEKICLAISKREKRSIQNINIIVSDDKTLNKMKMEYFGDDVFTDTISFNFNEENQAVEGEIYLSIDRIKENSKKYGIPFKIELANIIIHSILHLFGYEDDNMENKKQMEDLQNFYLGSHKISRLFKTNNLSVQ